MHLQANTIDIYAAFSSECIYLYLKEIGKELYLDWIESLNSEWREGGGLCTETQSANPYTPAKILMIAKQRNYLQVYSKRWAQGNF